MHRRVVGRHPFGGFKMSGGGTKRGADYLLQSLCARCDRKYYRHGFAPEKNALRDEFLPQR